VKHCSPDLGVEELRIVAVVPLEGASVDRDQVRKCAAVGRRATRVGDAVVEPEQRLAGRRLVLDHDRDVVDQGFDLGRQGVESLHDPRLDAIAVVVPPSSVVAYEALPPS
jgi:hypothetical protein